MRGRGGRFRGGAGRHGPPAVTIQRFLEPTLLLLLRRPDGARHGYDLAQDLAQFGLGDVDSSVVYRALRAMEERGLVRSDWEQDQSGPARRVYTLTVDGREMLGAWVRQLQATVDMLERFIDIYEGRGEQP